MCDVKGPLHLYDTCGVLRSLLDRYCVPWREAGEDSRVIYVLGDLTPADGARLETMARAGATVAVLDLPQGVKRVVNEMELADGCSPFRCARAKALDTGRPTTTWHAVDTHCFATCPRA